MIGGPGWPAREAMRRIFLAGIGAVRAEHYLPQHLPSDRPAGRTAMIAVGKAAGDMAQVALQRLTVDHGLVIVPKGGLPSGFSPPDHVEIITAAHPVPDAESQRAGRAALALAQGLGAADRLLVLLSGGGSSLMVAPRPPLGLEDKIRINDALLRSGAPIGVMNRIRRALSDVKGGALALAAAPADVITLVLSDIPGDDLSLVSSGPTVMTPADEDWPSLAAGLGIAVPAMAARPPAVSHATIRPPRLVASAAVALAEMATTAQAMGFQCLILGDAMQGDAVALAQAHAAAARSLANKGIPTALLSGGEASVATGNATGKGGRNLSFALALAIELQACPDICGFAADSDGIDGSSRFAGAMVLPDTLERCRIAGLDPSRSLSECNSESIFTALENGLLVGPTFTNVNDLRCILVGAPTRGLNCLE